MTIWILAVLALFVAQTFLPNMFRYRRLAPEVRRQEVMKALGPRDEIPPAGVYGDRAARALANMQEALPVFLALALLLHSRSEIPQLGHVGAGLFLAARVVFVPSYILGVFGLRSAVWMLGVVGLFLMIAALIQGGVP